MPKVLCEREVLHKDVTISTFIIGSHKIINDKVNEESRVGFYFIFTWRKTCQIKKCYMVEPYNEILSLRQADRPSNFSSSKDTYLCIICNASLPHFKCFSLLHRGQITEVIYKIMLSTYLCSNSCYITQVPTQFLSKCFWGCVIIIMFSGLPWIPRRKLLIVHIDRVLHPQ